MGSCSRRAVQIAASSTSTAIHRTFSNYTHSTPITRNPISYHHASSSSSAFRHFSQLSTNFNGKRAFLVDTLSLVRGLEAQGVPAKQAEAITGAITLVSKDTADNVAQSCASKIEIQKVEMNQESNLSQFKSEVKSILTQFKSEMINSQENHISSLQHETEKLRNENEMLRGELKYETEKLRNDIEKLRSEVRYEIDKVNAGQRLDLNLERGRISDELANQNAETTNLNTKFDKEFTNLNNKIDREKNAYMAKLEASKYEVIKYCIGTFVSISAIGLAAIIRVMM